MTKSVGFLAAVLLAPLLFPQEAAAVQRKHRPWFSRSITPAKPDRPQTGPGSQPVRAAPDRRDGGKLAPHRPGEQISNQALRYKGTRYRYGGTTKKGMDCSGLVARVWQDLKMNKVPRASASLYSSGKPVRLSELRPGDLVFFKNTYKRGVSHVGVYAGSNKFIHASGERKGVTVTKLSDPYYQIHYAGARRLY